MIRQRQALMLAFVIPLIWATVAFWTIGDYGVNPDEPGHFRRGQAYLHYFLTGKKNYNDLPKRSLSYAPVGEKKNITTNQHESYRRSFYQDDGENGEYFLDAPEQQSHPPLNDTFAALGNYIFYQRLGWMDDVDSHHVFGLVVVTLLIFVVYLFAQQTYGVFAGIIAALAVALYPVLFGESHFNVKDPPETAFYALTIFFFWWGVSKKNAKALFASSIACSLALGTKLNIVFVPFILLPWLIAKGVKVLDQPKRVYKMLLLYPLIVLAVFFGSNPNLWENTVFRLSEMARFYQSVGTTSGGVNTYQPGYLYFGFNIYPALAVLYQTPLIILFFATFGIAMCIKRLLQKKSRDKVELLFLLWLLVPIIRVTLPGTTIYGGIRHIFEYIPAMAILAGVGAHNIVIWLYSLYLKRSKDQMIKRSKTTTQQNSRNIKLLIQGCILASFVPITLKLISLHPNQNVYFNPLIGGLRGAKERNFPYWGSSLGNTYLQGVKWINEHADENACIGTPIALLGNVPYTKLRSDITYHNTCLSGKERKGEYAMDMIYQGYFNDWYSFAYYETYTIPVYDVQVEGVSIFKVFKNDLAHTKPGYEVEEPIIPTSELQEESVITFTLPKKVVLSNITFSYDLPAACAPISDGFVLLSGEGEHWTREADNITVSHGRKNFDADDKKIERQFAAKPASFIRVVTNLEKNCKLELKDLIITHHPELNPDQLLRKN